GARRRHLRHAAVSQAARQRRDARVREGLLPGEGEEIRERRRLGRQPRGHRGGEADWCEGEGVPRGVAIMILLIGDFSIWSLLIGACVFGVTTALIVGAIAAAAAGGVAYEVSNAVQGNWPWEDPEAWILGHLKGELGGLGSVISAAQGEPTIQTQLAGEAGGTSRGGGTGGVLQGATGQGLLQEQNATLAGGVHAPFQLGGGAGPQPQPMGGQAMGGEGGGGAGRYDAMDAAEQADRPSRGKILAGAGKDIGIGLATTAASVLPVVGQLGSVAGTAAQFADVAAGASSTAAEGAGAAVRAVGALGGQAASTAPSFASSALHALRAVPETIGTTATGVLQKSLLGAGMGAAGAALKGEDPLRAAAMGGAGGAVSGIAGYGAQQFAPPPVPTIQLNPFPMPEISAPSFVGGTAPAAPTLGSFAASKLPSLLGSGASQGVGYLMTPPQPSQPAPPAYSSRPTYADVYDIGGPNAVYGGRGPDWGGWGGALVNGTRGDDGARGSQ